MTKILGSTNPNGATAKEVEICKQDCLRECKALKNQISNAGGGFRDLLQFDCDILEAKKFASSECDRYQEYIDVYDPIQTR
jgi:hypothetical protein